MASETIDAKAVLARLFVFGLVVGLIVGTVAAVSYVYDQPEDTGPDREALPENPEFDRDRIVPDRLATSGSVTGVTEANRSFRGRRVLIDVAHGNRVEREDLQPLVSGLVRAGHEVQLLQERKAMDRRLRNADALIVVDPAEPYRHAEVRRVNQFTERGGRLLLLGEPNLNAIQTGLFGTSISTQRSQLTELAASYGIAFDTEYVYNLENNDGNYQHVLAKPGPRANLASVNQAATYIAAPVRVRKGKRVLVAERGTNQAGSDGGGPYPLAVRHANRNVTAVGDVSLFTAEHATVADNEHVVAAIGSFLVSGSRHLPDAEGEPPGTPTPPAETPGDEGGDQPPQGETPTPTATPDSTATPAAS